MIRVENMSHHYGVWPVLVDINMQIKTGELVVLLGPNGMGKTTLLGCLAGVLWPQRGFVEFDGVRRRDSVDSEQAIRQQVAFVPDDAWLPPLRTGRENTCLPSVDSTVTTTSICSITPSGCSGYSTCKTRPTAISAVTPRGNARRSRWPAR